MNNVFRKKSNARLAGLGIGLGTPASKSNTSTNRFGGGISNTDLTSNGDGDGDAQPLDPNQLNPEQWQRSRSVSQSSPQQSSSSQQPASSSQPPGRRSVSASHAQNGSTQPDDFGRVVPSQRRPSNGAVNGGAGGSLPVSGRSPQNQRIPAFSQTVPSSSRRMPSGSYKTDLPPVPSTSAIPSDGMAAHGKEAFPYGYTHEGWDAEVTVAAATQVMELCGKEIKERGLDAPLIFSSMALDLTANGVKSLIKSFLAADQSNLANSAFAQEVRFANPHNLAAMIKWSLARLSRFYTVPVPSSMAVKRTVEIQEEVAVVQQRGCLDSESYVQWKEAERAASYPWTGFTMFSDSIDAEAAALLRSLFSLLSSTVSYSHKNGMTPSKVSRLFGVLLFGLPEDESFARTYESFTRASNATEHLLLAYIRDLAAYEVLPIRLMAHVEAYPQMLAADISKPSNHARMVSVTQIERQVRLYSQDLVQSACELDVVGQSQEWRACCSSNESHGKEPQLSDRFRKLMNIRGNARHGRSATSTPTMDLLRSNSSASQQHDSRGNNDPASYTTIAQQEWGDFLSEGFAEPNKEKLNFDLTESRRKETAKARDNVAWSDFASTGFNDRDENLAAVLNFDEGFKDEVQKWPGERADLLNKLRETAAKMPPFPYDNTPKVVVSPSTGVKPVTNEQGEQVSAQMDDVFPEVWADYLIGNGWSNRDELAHRGANFVILQFKSRPHEHTVGAKAAGASRMQALAASQTQLGAALQTDDRIDAAWFVIQEIVPLGYRADLEAAGKVKNRSRSSMRKLNVFSRKSRKDKDKSGATVARNNSLKDTTTDNFFPPGTKKLQLNPDPVSSVDPDDDATGEIGRGNSVLRRNGKALFTTPLARTNEPEQTSTPAPIEAEPQSKGGFMSALKAKAKLRGRKSSNAEDRGPDASSPGPPAPPAKTSGLSSRRRLSDVQTGFRDPEDSFHSSDFDTVSVDDPADVIAADQSSKPRKKKGLLKHNRRESLSKDDAWVDIVKKGEGDGRPRYGRSSSAAKSTEDLQSRGRSSSPLGDTEQDVTDSSTPRARQSPPSSPGRLEPLPEKDLPLQAAPALLDVYEKPIRRGNAGGSATSLTLQPSRSPDITTAPGQSSPRLPPIDLGRQYLTKPTDLLRPTSTVTLEGEEVFVGARQALYQSSAPPSPSEFPAPAARTTSLQSPNLQSRSPNLEATRRSPSPSPVVPSRSGSKPPEGSESGATSPMLGVDKSKEERVSAALLRARELRARLQPVDSRKSPSSTDDPEQFLPTGAASQPSRLPKPKVDPFAKNPTSGKVASIAARFGAPGGSGASVPSVGSSGSMRPGGSSDISNRSPSLSGSTGKPVPGLPGSGSAFSSGLDRNRLDLNTSDGPRSLTEAAVATLPSAMVHPDVPPSPRGTASILGGSVLGGGDHESIGPDDAASNYSRSTEESEPLNSKAAGFGGTSWTRESEQQHYRQQALQDALVGGGSGQEYDGMEVLHDRDGGNHLYEGGGGGEEYQAYQPGQPLETLTEDRESLVSGR